MQKIVEPLVDADIEMVPQTRERAELSDSVQRVLALVQGKQGSNLLCLQVNRNGQLVTGYSDKAGWVFNQGTGADSAEVFPFGATVDFDYIDILVTGSCGRLSIFDRNGNQLEYAMPQRSGMDPGLDSFCQFRIDLKANYFIYEGLHGVTASVFWVAGRKP